MPTLRVRATLCCAQAFHDVMKVQALLPVVTAEHAPYENFKAGDVINDHDIALAYVLDHCPEVLPSCAAQSADDQRTIRFTQSKMAFNHGWLVQVCAPWGRTRGAQRGAQPGAQSGAPPGAH